MMHDEYEIAKTSLEKAAAIDPQRRVFKLWADLAQKSGASEASIRHRLEQISDAKEDPTWICKETGQTYDTWSAIAQPHNAFNTMIWESSDNIRRQYGEKKVEKMYDLLSASS